MRRFLQVTIVTMGSSFVLVPSALAVQAPDAIDFAGTIDRRILVDVDDDDPLRLSPTQPAAISVEVTNKGSTAIRVDRIRLEGRVLGLAFMVYTTDVGMDIEPGDTGTREYQLNLRDLDGEATGTIPASLILLDSEGHDIGRIPFPVEIDGSMRSVYGIFGLAVAGMTVVLLVAALWRLSTGRLPLNRWRRAMTFAAPGLGVGFVLTFTLSALNLVVADAGAWLLTLALGGGIGFAAGYLTPTPDSPVSDGHDWDDRTGLQDQQDQQDELAKTEGERSSEATGRRRADAQ
jgi:hypothetical protein